MSASNMADEMPVIPKAGTILVHTGNVVNWNRLKKRMNQKPTEELIDTTSEAIKLWKDTADKTELQYATDLEIINETNAQKLEADERNGLKVTVKIFLSKLEVDAVKDAVQQVMNHLDTSSIETVLLAIPEQQYSKEKVSALWESLEEMVDRERVFTLGMSDLSRPQLEELYDSAKVKPCINQVNLGSCCVMPPELTEFAKENDIQLLTHHDPTEILPESSFQEMMETLFTTRDKQNWEPSWVIRYSVLVKCRGIIKSKGYLVKATRDIKKKRDQTM